MTLFFVRSGDNSWPYVLHVVSLLVHVIPTVKELFVTRTVKYWSQKEFLVAVSHIN